MGKTINKLHIVCYKWGDKYSSNYVNKLYEMVKRNLDASFVFHCITDNSLGIIQEVIVHAMPSEVLNGNGPKIFTFSKNFLDLSNDDYVVSLDLDIVVVSSLNFLTQKPEYDFIIARHRSYPNESKIHGAVYRLRVGAMSFVWDTYIANHNEWATKYRWKDIEYFSEQAWLEAKIPTQSLNFFDYEKIISFKSDCNSIRKGRILNKFLKTFGLEIYLNPFQKAKLPNIGESIISFAGDVSPQCVLRKPKGRFRHAPFIAQYWK